MQPVHNPSREHYTALRHGRGSPDPPSLLSSSCSPGATFHRTYAAQTAVQFSRQLDRGRGLELPHSTAAPATQQLPRRYSRRYSRGSAGGGCSNGARRLVIKHDFSMEIAAAAAAVRKDDSTQGRRLYSMQHNITGHPKNDEGEFEFLRSLLQEAAEDAPAASTAGRNSNPTAVHGLAVNDPCYDLAAPYGTAVDMEPAATAATAAAAAAAAAAAPVAPLPLQNRSHPPMLFAGSAAAAENGARQQMSGSSNQIVFDGAGEGPGDSGSACDAPPHMAYHVTEEEQLEAADDVAACIWLADDRVRKALIARVRDTWLSVGAEFAADAAIDSAAVGVATAARATATAQQHRQQQLPGSRRKFRDVLLTRLEATRKAVEEELRAADEAAAASGNDTVLCDPWRWRGSTALRGDVLAKLESFQQDNIRDPTSGEYARFSTVNCREDLLERLRGTRDAVMASVTAATGSGGSGAGQAEGAPWTERTAAGSDCAGLKQAGGLPDDLMGQQWDANHAAAEAEGPATRSESSGDLRQGLVEMLEATRVVATAELFRVGEGMDNAAAVSSGGGDCSSDSIGARGVQSRGEDLQGGKAGHVSSAEEGAAGASGGARKRKRSGSGGRRCKHDGCTLHPHFGLTRPEYCSRHKLPGMFNVKGRRCVDPECKRTPVYGKAGDPHPTYCAAHKLVDMVDIKNPTCREPTCFRQPSFGSAEDRKATYCASHMLDGMVNVRRMLASSKSSSKAVST